MGTDNELKKRGAEDMTFVNLAVSALIRASARSCVHGPLVREPNRTNVVFEVMAAILYK